MNQQKKQKKTNMKRNKQNNNRNNPKNAPVSEVETVLYSDPILNRSKEFVVSKREFIADLASSAAAGFNAGFFEINPGIPQSFPWASGLAQSFEKYIIEEFKVIYQPASSTFVPGTFMMAPDFDPDDPPPDSKATLLDYQFAVRSPLWKYCEMKLPRSAIMNQKTYFVRGDQLVTDGLKFYDPMKIYFSIDNKSVDVPYWGELWFEYRIRFLEPQRISLVTEVSQETVFLTSSTAEDGLPLKGIHRTLGTFPIAIDEVNGIVTFLKDFIGSIVVSGVSAGNDQSNNFVLGKSLDLTPIAGAILQNIFGVGGRSTNAGTATPENVVYNAYCRARSGQGIKFENSGVNTPLATTPITNYNISMSPDAFAL